MLEHLEEPSEYEVYQGRDSRSGRDVALRCLPLVDAISISKLRHSVENAKTLLKGHRNVLVTEEVVVADGNTYFVTKQSIYVTLASQIPGVGFSPARALYLAYQVASALAAAHDVGMIHGGLHPQLVLMVICESCDQQNSLRLQSMGVHSILLPPFDRINMVTEISSAGPSTTQYKRNPDLMRRAQARLDMLIPSDLGYVLGINHEISLLLKEFGFPPQDTRINVPLACDEAITNAIVHGNDSQVEKKVAIQIYVSHSRFRIRVRDNGSGFDVATVADPTKGDNVMRSSGRGVYLMRKIMDSVEYKEDGRVLELEKRNSNAPD